MPRPGSKIEKSKDFKGSIKKIFKSLAPWHIVILISVVLATSSAIIYLIAPNKLSSLTDYITEGLKPNMNEATITEIMSDTNISASDKAKFMEFMNSSSTSDQNEILEKMDNLPEPVYDKIKPNMNMDAIRNIAILLAVLYVLSSLFNYIQQLIMAKVTNNYGKMLRSDITNKIERLPLKYFDKHETGDVLSRVTNDVDTLSISLNQSLASLISNVMLFVGSIIMMFVTNWIMAITGIVSSIIGFMFMGLILSKSQKYFVAKQEQLGDLNGYIEEMYSGHNVIVSYNARTEVEDEFDKLNGKLYESSRKSQFLSGIMPPMMGFVGNLGYVAVCVVGAILCINHKIDFGVIVAFMIYVRMFTNPLSQIAQSVTSFQSIAAAGERVFEFLEEKEMKDESSFTKKLENSEVKGEIIFDHVKFGYDKGKTIIKDFSAKINPGDKVAIVGPTGAGKTTMVNLLMKFYDINEGNIYIDGVSTKDLTRENIHDLFCMVLQDTWLFDGTIKENLKFNNNKVTDEEIWEACKVVGVDHFIKTLPGGIDSSVSDSDNISSGQKQLLTIVRGMLEHAPFLILDEATSNVDTRTEELVQKGMDKLTEGKTSFIIAHRLSTIKNADLILVMKDGNIIETGNHNKLMKQNGFYADLYNSQFKM